MAILEKIPMDTNDANDVESQDKIQITTGFLKKSWLSTSSFVLAFLLFFLPFVTIRCNGEPIARATGVQLAFGVPMESAGILHKIKKKSAKKFTYKLENDHKTSPNPYALAAMVLLLLGAVESVLHFRHLPLLKSIFALLAIMCLLFLQIDIVKQVRSDYDPSTGRHEFLDDSDLVNIQTLFSPWYYVTIGILLLLVFLGVWQWRKRR